MKVLFGGNPLNIREDSKAIYTQPCFIPATQPWDDFPVIKKNNITDFVKNLYYVTMEKNGYSYFYPNIERNTNLCRFEWHYDFRGEDYFLRVGLTFQVKELIVSSVGYYIQTHKSYEDINNSENSITITGEESEEIKLFIKSNLEEAYKRINCRPDLAFNPIYYIKLPKPFIDIVEFGDNFTLLPSRIIENETISALIIPVKGFSYLSCKRFSDERANLFCALLSFVVGYVKLVNIKNSPLISKIPLSEKDNILDKLENFYPEGKSDFHGWPEKVIDKEISMFKTLYECFSKVGDEDKRKLVNIIFSFYSAKEAMLINKTLALVSYVACLDSIGKECAPEIHKNNGSRKAIVHHIKAIFDEDSIIGDIDKWSKRIYNKHRSSYVHGASIKFEEYSQNMDGKNFAGLPRALPTNSKPVSKQYEYDCDIDTLINVTQLVLIKYMEHLSGGCVFDNAESIDFTIISVPEAHIGAVNRGWCKVK